MPADTWQHQRNVRRRQIRTRPAAPHTHAGSGLCRWCGLHTQRPRQRWHEDCAAIWRTGSSRRDALAHLLPIHGAVCWACGVPTDAAELCVDHTRPLWSLAPTERLEPRWWLPFNLQLLCTSCHAVKTGVEARQRAGKGAAA